MSQTFLHCWAFTLDVEKGFFADPVGGDTMWGITERVARAWGYKDAMKDLPIEVAQAIAQHEYFDRYQCDQLPRAFAMLVFDTAYHGGKPVKWLQMAIGVPADGIIGAKTIAAARAANVPRTVALFCAARIRYLQSLKNFRPNAGGWMLRIAGLLERGVA